MGKRILVTGAGGYIGRHVVAALCDRGVEVLAMDFRTDGIDSRAEILGSSDRKSVVALKRFIRNWAVLMSVCIWLGEMALYTTPTSTWKTCRLITGSFKG